MEMIVRNNPQIDPVTKRSTARLIGHDGVNLKPGANKVPVSWAKEAIKHPIIKIYMDEGMLEFDFPAGKEALDLTQYLTTLKQTEAVSTVKSTIDLGLLKAWFKVEKRPQVKGAINKQLAALAEPTKYRDEETSSDDDKDEFAENLNSDFSDDSDEDEE